jgi:predicted esterase
MTRLIAGMAVLIASASASWADGPVKIAGEWRTTAGPVTFQQNGDDVTGKIVAFNLALKGKVEDGGKKLAVSYTEQGAKVEASLEFDPSGNAFTGTSKSSNGNSWDWSGWRPDPTAATGKQADFSGLWLTEQGLMELIVDKSKVKGRYALRGTSSLEGDIKGRHIDFRLKSLWFTGPGFFDLDDKGVNLAGAGGTDGRPVRWFGWKGRKAPEYVRHAPLVAGQIVDGSTENLLTYSVRAPEGYKAGDSKKWPVVLVFHGSNMNGKAYVNTVAGQWPDIAKDYILLGINGETPAPTSISSEEPVFNFTYVNFMGKSTYGGYPGTDRESPALVRDAMEDLKKAYPIKHYFVGGHSQGGFLTYAMMMNSPDLIAGVFPVSGNLLIQADPTVFEDKALKEAQRAIPLAIVHGKNDPVRDVPFDGAVYAHGQFLDAGWPAIRLFAHPNAGHMFALLPVGEAIRWLEALTSDDPKVLLDFAEARLKDKEPHRRDAIAALRRAKGLKLDAKDKARFDKLAKDIDAKVAPKAKKFLSAIKANKDGSWVDDFLAFREEYEYADAASAAMEAFAKLREEQDPLASKAMGEARQAFNQGRRPEGYAKAKEIAAKYYASTSYRLARKWAAEQR